MAPKPKRHPSNLQMKGDTPPWYRLAGEPDDAYLAFCAYRDMPISERTFRAIAHIRNCTEAVIEAWAEDWHWMERTADFALATRDAIQGDLVQLQKQVATRQREMCEQLSELLRRKVLHMKEQPMADVKPRDISMLAGANMLIQRQERITVGLPSDSVRPASGASSANVAVVVDEKLLKSLNRFSGGEGDLVTVEGFNAED